MLVHFSSINGKIGIFGGSFDPVHLGHIEIAKLVKSSLALDRVIFIPAKQNPLKKNNPLASEEDRLQMLSLALKDFPEFAISDVELKQKEDVNFTVKTLKEIRWALGDNTAELFFILGADQITNLHLWKDYKELFSLVTLVVLGRLEITAADFTQINPELSKEEVSSLTLNFIKYENPVSSTEIRELIKESNFDKAQQYLPKGVLSLIGERKIYF